MESQKPDKLMIDPRKELEDILKNNLGEWFRVSYEIKQNSDGSFDIEYAQVERRNG